MRCNGLLLVALTLTVPRLAFAFEDASQFFAGALPHAATLTSSSEGVYFTGAPRFSGLDCSTCHTEGRQQVGLHLDTNDTSLFSFGYNPGQTYELVVRLRNEREGRAYDTPTCTEVSTSGDFVPCNNNNFALEIDGPFGPLGGSGVFCAQPPIDGVCPAPAPDVDSIVIAPDGDAVFGNRRHDPAREDIVTSNGATAWHLWWTAPGEGTGPLKIFVAAVDGNGGSGSAEDNQDPAGDDTVRGVFTIAEGGVRYDLDGQAGCRVAGARQLDGLAILFVLVGLGVNARRRGRSCDITES